MNKVQVLNKFKAPGSLPQGLSGVEMALWMILVEKGEKRLYGIPVLDALDTGTVKSFIAVKLRDENGKEIASAEPISVGTNENVSGFWSYTNNGIYVGFSDKKIRAYNVDMTPKIAYGTNYFYTTTDIPNGIHAIVGSGAVIYCSTASNKLYAIEAASGTIIINCVVGKRTDPNDSSVIGEYVNYNPTAISDGYMCSSTKVSRWALYPPAGPPPGGQSVIYITSVIQNNQLVLNEFDSPAPVVGIDEGSEYLVDGGKVLYLSCTDGNIYKCSFVSKTITTNGSLTVLDQFTGKTNQRGIHTGYKIPYIKIAGQSKDGYLKKSGTTYTAAVASTPVVTINGGSGVKYVGTKRTGTDPNFTYEIYRSYLSFDTKFIDFVPGVIHLYLKTVTLTVADMELLVYEMPAYEALTATHWGAVGRLLVTKDVCAYHSIYLPLDVDLTNGLYIEIRGSQEGTNSYTQDDLVTITAYELRIFS